MIEKLLYLPYLREGSLRLLHALLLLVQHFQLQGQLVLDLRPFLGRAAAVIEVGAALRSEAGQGLNSSRNG